ncbi:MAG: methyltransferase, FxLD system [Streptosporangiaceae bacterium]
MSDELDRLRERLASRVITVTRTRSDLVAAALRAVPRHLFLPDLPPEAAYRDDAIVTKRDADGQGISSSSQPAIMAIMLDQLHLAPGHRVLEIGAGTGYNAALMAYIVGASGQVVSVDIDADTAAAARTHLDSAGYPDVTVVCADGAGGYPAGAPYDRVIATVGVSDLARAWLEQVTPDARIVVPLDLRGTQLSIAFGQAAEGYWRSRSLVPCGFMRMRGSLAGPERTVLLQPGLSLLLPEGGLADGQELDAGALAAVLAEPPAMQGTDVRAGSDQVFWGLGLWLAARDPRLCRMNEELPAGAGGRRRSARRSVLARAPLRSRYWRTTLGILESGGIAVLTATPVASAPGERAGAFQLSAAGFGMNGPELAGELAAHVRAWREAERPATAGLRVDAYPRALADAPDPAGAELVIDRADMRFVVSHT